MGLGSFLRSLAPGNDRELAASQYADQESASDRASRRDAERQRAREAADAEASRRRAERHRARVQCDGDNAGMQVPRRHRKHGNGAFN